MPHNRPKIQPAASAHSRPMKRLHPYDPVAQSIYAKEYRRRNPEKVRAWAKKTREKRKELHRIYKKGWCARNRLKLRDQQLFYKFGINLETFNKMLVTQDNRCAICQRAPGRLVVDHDHVSGRVRALLCDSCNHVLGFARESEEILEAAIHYLRQHRRG